MKGNIIRKRDYVLDKKYPGLRNHSKMTWRANNEQECWCVQKNPTKIGQNPYLTYVNISGKINLLTVGFINVEILLWSSLCVCRFRGTKLFGHQQSFVLSGLLRQIFWMDWNTHVSPWQKVIWAIQRVRLMTATLVRVWSKWCVWWCGSWLVNIRTAWSTLYKQRKSAILIDTPITVTS